MAFPRRGLFLLFALLPLVALAADKVFTITDVTGRGWMPQVVTYRVKFDRPTRADELSLTDDAGKTLVVQADAEKKDKDFRFTEAIISFLAGVPANGTARYILHTEPKTGNAPDWVTSGNMYRRIKADPIHVSQMIGSFTGLEPMEQRIRQAGLMLSNEALLLVAPTAPVMVTYKQPVPVNQAPAPIWSISPADMKPLGGTHLVTDRLVKSFSGKLLAAGPVYATVQYEYQFVPKGYYRITIRLDQGAPMAFIDEEYDFGEFTEGKDLLVLDMAKGWSPDTLCWRAGRAYKICPELDAQMKQVAARGWKPGARAEQDLNYFELPLTAAASQDGTYVNPWGNWGVSKPLPPASAWLTVQPWMDWGTGADFLALAKTNGVEKEFPEVGFLVLHTGSWRRPYESMPWLTVGKDGGASLNLPISCFGVMRPFNPFDSAEEDPAVSPTYGRRVWGLTLAPLANYDQARDWRTGYGLIGLDRYKEWVLDWDDPPGAKVTYPRAYASPVSAQHQREAADWPGKAFAAKMYVVNPTEANGKVNADWAVGRTTQYLGERRDFPNSHYRQAESDMQVIGAIDSAFTWPNLPAEQRKRLRAVVAAACYELSDPDFNPRGVGIHLGNPNMPMNRYNGLPQYAALIPTHPRYQQWIGEGKRYLEWKLSDYLSPGGAWREEMGYQQTASDHAMQALLALSNSGEATDLMIRHARAWHDYTLACVSPEDLNADGLRICEGTGNGAKARPESEVYLANVLREKDPDYASELMWLWHATKGETWTLNTTNWLPFDPSITPKAPKDIPGAFLPGFGATSRTHFGTPNETFLMFREGHNQSHYGMDQGTFKLYAYGEALIPNSGHGYGAPPAGTIADAYLTFGDEPEWANNHGRADTMVADYAYMPTLDYFLGRQHFDEKSKKFGTDIGCKVPFDWYRQFMVMKSHDAKNPTYLVLRDTLRGPELPTSHWQSWMLPHKDAVTVVGNRVTGVTTRNNALDLIFLEPKAINPRLIDGPKGEGQARGFPGGTQVRVDQATGGEYFLVLYPRKADMPSPQVSYPAQGVVKVITQEGTDYLFISPDADIKYDDGEVKFQGRCGAVRLFGKGVELALASGEGRAQYHQAVIEGIAPIFHPFPDADDAQTVIVRPEKSPYPTLIPPFATDKSYQAAPGVEYAVTEFGIAYIFDSPTVIDFAKDGVVFHGRKGAIFRNGDTVRYIQEWDPGVGHLARIGYKGYVIRGEGPFDLTFKPSADPLQGGEVTGRAYGRARLLEMPIPDLLTPKACPQKALPVDQILAQEAGIIITGTAPQLTLNGEQWQLGWYDRMMAVPLRDGDNAIRITRFQPPPAPALPERRSW